MIESTCRLPLKNIILLFAFLISFVLAGQQSNPPEPQSELDPVQVEAIPISSLSSKSEAVLSAITSSYLPTLSENVIQRNSKAIKIIASDLDSATELTNYALDENFPAEVKQGFVEEWEEFLLEVEGPLQELNDYVNALERIRTSLAESRLRWGLTKSFLLTDTSYSIQSLQRVEFILDKLDAVSNATIDSLDLAVTLQNKLVDIKLKANNLKQKQESELGLEFGSMVGTKKKPLWKIKISDSNSDKISRSRKFYDEFNKLETWNFIEKKTYTLALYAVLIILFYQLLRWMRKKIDSIDVLDEETLAAGKATLQLPMVSALFFASITSILFFNSAPLYIRISVIALIFSSFTILTPYVVAKELRFPMYAFTLLFLLGSSQNLRLHSSEHMRLFELFESSIMLLYFVWLNKAIKKFLQNNTITSLGEKVLRHLVIPFIILSATATLANLGGYVYLSYVLTSTMRVTFFIAAIFGVVYSSFTAIFIIFMHTPLAEVSRILTRYRDYIIKRTRLFFQILYLFFLLRYTLQSLFLYDPIMEGLQSFLAIGFTMQDSTISIGSVLGFFLITLLSWLLANFIRLLLQDEILSRFKLARGITMAVGSLSFYILISIGFLFALIKLGFTLTQLGVMVGALGIGIGFGLQNVVSNFISGLILIFERPITVGDIVNLQNIEGQVTSIGIRSSQVRQYDGSVMIVPNSDLISQKVINYSLTSYRRRFEIPIYTSEKVNPEEVLEIIHSAINEVDGVLKHPPAKAYFNGTEKQSKYFKLYYWVPLSKIMELNSEANIAVHNKLAASGIEVRTQHAIEIKTNAENQSETPSPKNEAPDDKISD